MAGTVIQPVVFTGREAALNPNFVAAAAQMELPNLAPTLLHMKATGAVTLTATNQQVAPPGTVEPNETVVMAAGDTRVVRFNSGRFNMSNGNVQLGFDTPANVTLVAYQLQ